jgi:sarcosine oxidase, subunit alpha
MEKVLQIDRPGWQVRVTNLTSQWTNATICGPLARAGAGGHGHRHRPRAAAFPFMGLRDGMVAGLTARVARVSFTGELSFEINVRPRDLPALWHAIMAAGAAFGIAPSARRPTMCCGWRRGSCHSPTRRTARPTPTTSAWAGRWRKTKGDFIGRRSMLLRRAGGAAARAGGAAAARPRAATARGAPLTPGGRREPSEGLVTACVRSVVHDRWVGLGLLRDGRSRIGGRAHVRLPEGAIEVEVVAPVFHDPEGHRMRG